MTLDNSVRRRFAWPVRALHWISAVLVLVAYLTSELAEEGEHGEAAGINWHVAAGLALLLLFLPRLLAKRLPQPGPLLPPPPRWTLNPEESCSGSSRPYTRSAPSAFTLKVADTELSMPPEIATTRPRRDRSRDRISRRRAQMRSISRS